MKSSLSEMHELLDDVVDEKILAAYEKLLVRDGSCPWDDAAGLVGGHDVVNELIGLGMAYRTVANNVAVPQLEAIAPANAVRSIALGLHAQATRTSRRAVEATKRVALRCAVASGAVDEKQVSTGAGIEIFTERHEVARLSYGLMTEASRDWMSLDTPLLEVPLTLNTFAIEPLESLRNIVRCRSIYDTGFLETQTGREAIEMCVRSGEEARLRPRIPMKMKLVDTATALLPLTTTGTTGALLVRNPVVCGGLRDYFEMLWQSSGSYRGSSAADNTEGLSQDDQELLAMLAAGRTASAMARKFDKTTRTVERKISDLRDRMGASTQFEMGVLAHRLGLIP